MTVPQAVSSPDIDSPPRRSAPCWLALLPLLVACQTGGASSATRAAGATVTFLTDIGDVVVEVEIAATPEKRARGLMFRESLGKYRGMVFLFPAEARHPFWMQDTLIPLDIIFLSAQGVVVGVVENAEPVTQESRTIDRASKYVVEVNGGFAARHRITPGIRARFSNIRRHDGSEVVL